MKTSNSPATSSIPTAYHKQKLYLFMSIGKKREDATKLVKQCMSDASECITVHNEIKLIPYGFSLTLPTLDLCERDFTISPVPIHFYWEIIGTN